MGIAACVLVISEGAGAAWQSSQFQDATFDSPVVAGNWLYFVDDAPEGDAVWKTDGTIAGTAPVWQDPGTHCSDLVLFKGAVYFLTGGADACLLWSTIPGSNEAATVTSFSGVTFYRKLFVAGDVLYFQVYDGTFDLGKTDGTAAGTGLYDLEMLSPGYYQGAFGNRVLMQAPMGSVALLVSWDGTPEGFQEIGGGEFYPARGGVKNGRLFFSSSLFWKNPFLEPQAGLWKTDGTLDGTVLVRLSNSCGSPKSTEDGVFFDDGPSDQRYLYYSDGTEAGTVQLHLISGPDYNDLAPGSCVYKESFYFTLYAPPLQLWKSNGTVAGTVPVADFVGAQIPSAGYPLSSKLLFQTYNAVDHTTGLWQTSGTAGSTRMIKTTGYVNDLYEVTEMGDSFFFAYSDTEHGVRELWVSDSTSGGTYKVPGIIEKWEDPADAGNLVYFKDRLFFKARQSMWVCESDGAYPCGDTHVVVDELAGLAGFFATEWPDIGSGLTGLGFSDAYDYDLENVHLTLGGVVPAPPEGQRPGDGWCDWFQLRLVEYVLCNDAFWAHDLVADAFRHNQGLFGPDIETLYAQTCTEQDPEGNLELLTMRDGFKDVIPALMLLGNEMRATIDGTLALGLGDTSPPFTVLPQINSYKVCSQGAKLASEVFNPAGDLDLDGIANIDEYTAAMTATGSYEVALDAITDPGNFWPDNPALPLSSVFGLASGAAILLAGLRNLRGGKR